MRSSERLDSEFMRSNQRLEVEGDMFHILMSLTKEKNSTHGTLFHFLRSLTQEKEIYFGRLVHDLQKPMSSNTFSSDGRRMLWKGSKDPMDKSNSNAPK